MMGKRNSRGRRDISLLPDDLLLTILLSLTTIEAIRTCVLSPMWRDLWTRLPKLCFCDNDASTLNLSFANLVDGALTRACDVLCFLEIHITNAANLDAPRLASWARAAAPRVSGRFKMIVTASDPEYKVLELPCFPRARDIYLHLTENTGLRLPMPSTGIFANLNILNLLNVCLFGDGGASLGDLISSRCPQLQYLRLWNVIGITELNIESKQLLELHLLTLKDLERLHVVAMKLLGLAVSYCYTRKGKKDLAGTKLAVVAPMLKEVSWEGFCPEEMRFDANKHLDMLTVCEFKISSMMWLTNYARIMEHFSHSDCLKYFINFPVDALGHKTLMEQMRLPRCQELELYVARNGHMIGSTLISLLNKRDSATKKLTCAMLDRYLGPCNLCFPVWDGTCVCDQPATWRDQEISIDSLEHLEFYDFLGTGGEADFIYFMCGHSSALKTVSITFSKDTDDPSDIRNDLVGYLPNGCSLDVSVRETEE